MLKRTIFSIFLSLSLTNCGILSDSGPTTGGEYLAGAVIGTAAGAGIGAAIGNAISNGSVEKSVYLGAGVGLAVGVAGTYAYKEIKIHNRIVDNDTQIESNRKAILSKQTEIDRLREEVLNDTYNLQVDQGRFGTVYDGATLGNYYR